MNKNYFLALIFIMLPLICCFSQEIIFSQPKQIPPPPESFSLGTYGDESTGIFTGAVQTGIPLHNFVNKAIDFPIHLAYSSNGIKVDDLTTSVGLGWNLSAGGIITRLVRGEADEKSYSAVPEDSLRIGSPVYNSLLRGASKPGGADLNRDQFNFNFNGYQGKFFIAHDNRIILSDPTPLKIIPEWGNPLKGFKVTTPEGYLYEFFHAETTINIGPVGTSHGHEEENTAWRLSRVISPSQDTLTFKYKLLEETYLATRNDVLVVSPLNELACPEGYTSPSETVRPVHPRYFWEEVRRTTKVQVIEEIIGSSGRIVFSHVPTNNLDANKYVLQNMKVLNMKGKKVEEFFFNYKTTTNKRTFLTSVDFAETNKSYQMDYYNLEDFPPRLSTAQDMFGYYNGKIDNAHLIPYFETPNDGKVYARPSNFQSPSDYSDRVVDPFFAKYGLLKRITYPTKGYSEFDYEANSVWGTKKIFSNHSLEVNLNGSTFDEINFHTGNIDPTVPATWQVKILDYDNNCSLSPHTDQVNFNLINHTDEGSGLPIDNDRYIKMSKKEGTVHYTPEWERQIQVSLESNADYTLNINGNLRENCYQAKAILYYTSYSILPGNEAVGGMRVKKITSVSPKINSTNTTTYYYNKRDDQEKSSGILKRSEDILPYKETVLLSCDGELGPSSGIYVPYTYLVYNLNSFGFIYDSQYEVVYDDVAVSYGGESFENGGERYKFLYEADSRGMEISGDRVPNLPLTNSGTFKGDIKEIEYLENTGEGLVVRKRIVNEYKVDERLQDFIFGYVVTEKYQRPEEYSYSYTCNEDDAKPVTRAICTTSHEHFYWKLRHDDKTKCIADGSNHQVQNLNLRNPCINNEGGVVSAYQMDNYNIYEYQMASQWKYLEKATVSEYFNNSEDSVVTVTNYIFKNPEHQQLGEKEVISSKGTIKTSSYYYPDDIIDSLSLGNKNLSSSEIMAYYELSKNKRHRVSTLIQAIHEENDSKIMERKTFNNDRLALPKTVYTSKNGNIIEEIINFKSYDVNGNLLEVQMKAGASTSYVWGYEGNFPVAKIENVEHDSLSEYINFEALNDSSKTDSEIRSELNNLRIGLPDAQVTTYTYDPLIGMTSITDPKGMTTFFEYDEFGRLEYLRDEEGNILKEHHYHYREILSN